MLADKRMGVVSEHTRTVISKVENEDLLTLIANGEIRFQGDSSDDVASSA